MKIAEKIAKLRKSEGLSQEDLANELNVSRQTVYKWESGIANPELEKIKNIAKMFDVSFDYLMDDDVETNEKKEVKKKPKFRGIYYTGEELELNHADIDHGHVDSKKRGSGRSDEFFEMQENTCNSVMELIEATEVFRLQPDANIVCFYNKEKGVFGLYYAGKVQFVCPIENFIDIEMETEKPFLVSSKAAIKSVGFGAGGINSVGAGYVPYNNVVESPYLNAILRYEGENGEMELELKFSANNRYLLDDAKGDISFWNCMTSALIEGLAKNLKKLCAKLREEKKAAKARDISKLPPVDIDFYTELNEELAVTYEDYLQEIESESSGGFEFTIFKLIGIGVGIGVLAAWIISLI